MCTSSTATPAVTGGDGASGRREEGEHRTQPLATGGERVGADLGDHAGVARHCLCEPLLDRVEVRRRGRACAARARACVMRRSRCGARRSCRRGGGSGRRRTRPRRAALTSASASGKRRTLAGRYVYARPAREHLAEHRHDPVEPEREERPQHAARRRDLENRQPPARSQHAAQLGEPARRDRRRCGRRTRRWRRRTSRRRTGAPACRPAPRSIDADFRRARSSIASEKSSPVTMPPSRSAATARSPVPQQASSTRSPGRTTACAASRRQRPVEPGRHDPVHHVVDGRDAVEHAADVVRGERCRTRASCAHPSGGRARCSIPSWSRQRATTKSTRSCDGLWRRGRSRARRRGSRRLPRAASRARAGGSTRAASRAARARAGAAP